MLLKVLASNAISTLLSIMIGGIVYVVVLELVEWEKKKSNDAKGEKSIEC